MISSPHEWGRWLSPKGAPVGRKRGDPWVRMLLNLLISNNIFIVEPGGPRRVSLALVLLVFGKIMSLKRS